MILWRVLISLSFRIFRNVCTFLFRCSFHLKRASWRVVCALLLCCVLVGLSFFVGKQAAAVMFIEIFVFVASFFECRKKWHYDGLKITRRCQLVRFLLLLFFLCRVSRRFSSRVFCLLIFFFCTLFRLHFALRISVIVRYTLTIPRFMH